MTKQGEFQIMVVDDDAAVRRALQLSLVNQGYSVSTFRSAEDFLENFDRDAYGCIVLDIRMPGIEGLELQQRLADQGCDLPIIFVTGHGNVPMSVRAIKRGAVDFLEKPFRRQVLLERISEARRELDANLERRELRAAMMRRLDSLTNRETEVLRLLLGEKPVISSKSLAVALDISPRTAEQHRAAILRKFEVASISELGVMLSRAGLSTDRLLRKVV